MIVGICFGKGGCESIFGLLLFVVLEERIGWRVLCYVGCVGIGFIDCILCDLFDWLELFWVLKVLFDGVFVFDVLDVFWVCFEFVGEVEFVNWMFDGVLCYVCWCGLCFDKMLEEIVVEF